MTPQAEAPPDATTLNIEREIRFAVVMYGGVSLAIYINGVTQELLRLSTATAQEPGDATAAHCRQPAGTVKTYRRLAKILSLSERERNALEAGLPDTPDLDALTLPATLSVKFVVDTISGTSAGGINGIFLGKALANNQSLDQLQTMWIEEGDLGKLINDRQSLTGMGALFPSPDPPRSLLNGQRMYRRLVEALDAMDAASPDAGAASAHVSELDVFATTTDVNGLPVFLKLADGVVTERRYKNVFQLRYRREDRDSDFKKDDNAFLAYAARCTSSFPVAFPPMILDDVGDVLCCMKGHRKDKALGSQVERWKRFFPAYQPNSDDPEADTADDASSDARWYNFSKRPFCDGGYLDNKPFSHAIDTFSQRVSRVPVDRKLIYIEPDPENAELTGASIKVPNAVENALLSQSLAHYETIREDIERVLERNLLIERINRILGGSDDDVAAWKADNTFDDKELFLSRDFGALLRKYGPAYGGYHRLKIGALTDEIGAWIGAAAEYQSTSAHVNGIRLLVRAWREPRYTPPEMPPRPGIKTEPDFLYDFDLSYRVRRLRFVVQRLDRMRRDILQGRVQPDSFGQRMATLTADMHDNASTLAVVDDLREALHAALMVLMQERKQLNASGKANTLATLIPQSGPSVGLLQDILQGRTFDERLATARQVLRDAGLRTVFDAIANALIARVSAAAIKASDLARGAFKAALVDRRTSNRAAIAELERFYVDYQGYDFVSFPVIYATNVGEELSTTEVIRISPEDAVGLIGARADDKRQKLAGLVLMHFGAFLETKWRRNDMLWGRLDGAERLITALLPQNCPKLQAALVRETQMCILQEHFMPLASASLLKYSSELVNRRSEARDQTRNLKLFFENGAGTPGQALLNEAVEGSLFGRMEPAQFLDYFKRPDGYQVSLEPTPSTSASSLSRATTVIGKMLETIGEDLKLTPAKSLGLWTSRAGLILWGLVEVSMPGTLGRLLIRYWIKVAYIVEAVLILGGIVFGSTPAETIGWKFLAITLAGQVVTWLLNDWFSNKTRVRRVLRGLAIGAVLGVVAVGAYTIACWISAHSPAQMMGIVRSQLAGLYRRVVGS